MNVISKLSRQWRALFFPSTFPAGKLPDEFERLKEVLGVIGGMSQDEEVESTKLLSDSIRHLSLSQLKELRKEIDDLQAREPFPIDALENELTVTFASAAKGYEWLRQFRGQVEKRLADNWPGR